MQKHSVGRLSTTILFAAVAAFGCGPIVQPSPGPTAQPGSNGDPNADDPNAGGLNGDDSNADDASDPNADDSNAGDPNADDASDPNACALDSQATVDPASETPSSALPTAGAGSTTCGAPNVDQAAVDSDGDGFSDAMEQAGLAALGIQTSGDDFNPSHKDIFVYVDYYATPPVAAVQAVVAAFANAPVWNPDGTNGIVLHVIWGNQPIPSCQQVQDLALKEGSDWTQFNTMKGQNFPLAWEPVAHYAIIANRMDSGSRSGWATGIPGHDFVVTLGDADVWKGGTQLQQAGTFMHELGHDLGLRHGGYDDDALKPNYLSIMSYNYQMTGLRWNGQEGVLDYSRLQIGPVNEALLHEDTGSMSAVAPTTLADLAPYGASFTYEDGYDAVPVMGLLPGPLDFNNNGQYDEGTVSQDLNADEMVSTIPASQNDWCNLDYRGGVDTDEVIGDVSMPTVVIRSIASQDIPPELDHP